jgi:hypothetical protein
MDLLTTVVICFPLLVVFPDGLTSAPVPVAGNQGAETHKSREQPNVESTT